MTKLEIEANKLMNELSSLMDNYDPNPSTLYHYTSFEGLRGILTTRQLWLSHHKYLNDPSEIEHGKNIILDIIQKSIPNNPNLCVPFMSKFNKIIEEGYNSFIISFCEKNDYLPAWRYYGQDGAGYSIGIKKEYFNRIRPTTEEEKRNGLLLFKVEYESEKSAQVQKIINKANDIYPRWQTKTYDEIKSYLEVLCSNFLTLLPCLKNPDYHDEHEWRLCLIKLYHEASNTWYPYELPLERLIFTKKKPADIPFLKRSESTVPRICSNEFSYSDIESICIGPRLDFLVAKSAIEKILFDAGTPVEVIKNIMIKKSSRPYQ